MWYMNVVFFACGIVASSIRTKAKLFASTDAPNIAIGTVGNVGFLSEEVLDSLMLVQVRPAMEKDGWCRSQMFNEDGSQSKVFRAYQYFALNAVVPNWGLSTIAEQGSFLQGSEAETRKFVVLIPYRKIEQQIINFWPFDTIVVGDINLASVGAIVLHPEGNAPIFDEGVSIELVPYRESSEVTGPHGIEDSDMRDIGGSDEPERASDPAQKRRRVHAVDGKREAVQKLLQARGFATAASEDMLRTAAVSAIYKTPEGRLIEMGAGPSFGQQNIDFISNRYNGEVSYGSEGYPYFYNGVTEALVGVLFVSHQCSALEGSVAPRWVGIRKAADDVFKNFWKHSRLQRPYRARPVQEDAWTNCMGKYKDELPAIERESFHQWMAVASQTEGLLRLASLLDASSEFYALFGDCAASLHSWIVAQDSAIRATAFGRILEQPLAFNDSCNADSMPREKRLAKIFQATSAATLAATQHANELAREGIRKKISKLEAWVEAGSMGEPDEASRIRLEMLRNSMGDSPPMSSQTAQLVDQAKANMMELFMSFSN